MPDLSYRESARDVERYDQFFLFHRAETDFATALEDIRECDDLSRGLVHRRYGADPRVMDLYNVSQGVAGLAVGELIGDPVTRGIANALYGSGELKLKRRVNLRRCMHFKGYTRFGISEGRWNAFNFDGADDDDIDEDDRQRLLALQALVASGPRPQLTELGL